MTIPTVDRAENINTDSREDPLPPLGTGYLRVEIVRTESLRGEENSFEQESFQLKVQKEKLSHKKQIILILIS